MRGAMGAAEEAAVAFRAVADDPATTVVAGRRECVDGAFEGVVGAVVAVGQGAPESLVVLVAAHVAAGHWGAPVPVVACHCSAAAVNAGRGLRKALQSRRSPSARGRLPQAAEVFQQLRVRVFALRAAHAQDGGGVPGRQRVGVRADALPLPVLAGRNAVPNTAFAAIAPSATTRSGSTRSSSAASHGRQAACSAALARWCSRRLPRGWNLKCLTVLVRYRDAGSSPASASARRSSCPAGPTKGLPSRSSRSPGCSPTSRV